MTRGCFRKFQKVSETTCEASGTIGLVPGPIESKSARRKHLVRAKACRAPYSCFEQYRRFEPFDSNLCENRPQMLHMTTRKLPKHVGESCGLSYSVWYASGRCLAHHQVSNRKCCKNGNIASILLLPTVFHAEKCDYT